MLYFIGEKIFFNCGGNRELITNNHCFTYILKTIFSLNISKQICYNNKNLLKRGGISISIKTEHSGYIDLFHEYLRISISMLFNNDDPELLEFLPNFNLNYGTIS
jgi:hypothetical protein